VEKTMNSTSKKVLIIGGGIAGLTSATLLRDAGCEVTVLEASNTLGGLAKSERTADGFPTEHSLRVYHDNYDAFFSILKKIPFDDQSTVFDQLVSVSFGLNFEDDNLFYDVKRKNHLVQKIRDQHKLFKFFRKHGLTLKDFFVLAKQNLMVRSSWQRFMDKANMSVDDFCNDQGVSQVYRKTINALHEIAYASSDKALALSSIEMNTEGNPLHGFYMMNGPTSERVFDPWEKYLKQQGVVIKKNTPVDELVYKDGEVISVKLGSGKTLKADLFICAVSNQQAARLMQNTICFREEQPLEKLHTHTEWSNGVQIFLSDLPEDQCFQPGMLFTHLDSPWKLVSIAQGEGFWKNVKLPENCRYVLSVTFSAVKAKGIVYKKPLLECTREELLNELLAQIKFNRQDLILDWHMDNAIVWMSDSEYKQKLAQLPVHDRHQREDGNWLLNFSPLSAPTPHSFQHEPTARTATANLYLAGDFCKTSRVINCMEKACESAYLAVDRLSKDVGLQKVDLPFKAYNVRKYRLLRTVDAMFFKLQLWVKKSI
jgi:uncharacterized protein with NAD-binding domain and iron-sulfur cluster